MKKGNRNKPADKPQYLKCCIVKSSTVTKHGGRLDPAYYLSLYEKMFKNLFRVR